EHVLECVLGVLARSRQHLARVGEQPLAVAVVDDPEGLFAAGPEQGDELLVGAQPEQPDGRPRRAAECCGSAECGGFQRTSCSLRTLTALPARSCGVLLPS